MKKVGAARRTLPEVATDFREAPAKEEAIRADAMLKC